jgi:hypothetical protein
MPPDWRLRGVRTSPGGRLRLRKNGGSRRRLLHEILRVKDWALDTIVQHQGVSLRRIAGARALRVFLFLFIGTILSP